MKTNSQKQLLMVDSSGSCVSLKLGTSAGLHYYDGQMLWVNPAATVTASAPRQPLTGLSTPTAPAPIPEKQTKAVPIIDPTTQEEIVIKPIEPEKKEEPAAPAPPLAQISQVPVVATPSVPLATVANPQLSLAYVSSPVQVNPVQTLFKLTQNVPLTTAPQQTRSVLDLFAKATSQSPQSILNASNIIQRGETKLPPNLQAEDDDRRKGRGRGNSRGANKTTNARGANGKGNAQQSRGKPKEPPKGPPPNPKKYAEENAKYTASLDGRFWCLSKWPTGERDEQHALSYGKHKLPVESNGVIRVVLYGGVNKYKVKLHLADEKDPLGQNDEEGWCVCTCSPNATEVQLSDEAKDLGWKVYSPPGELPSLYPPTVETPTNNDAKAEE